MKAKVLALSLVALVSGCASSDRLPYYLAAEHLDTETHSEALVIAHASGMRGGLRDNDLSADIAKQRSSVETSIDNTLALSSSTTGLSMPAAFVAGTAIAAITSDDSAKGNKLLAWMPPHLASSPKDAQKTFHRMVLEAIESAADELSITLAFNRREHALGLLVTTDVDLESAEIPCETGRCKIRLVTRRPTEQLIAPPAFTGLSEGHLFDARVNRASFDLKLEKEAPEAKMALFQAISRRLPEWVYFYVGPDSVFWPYMINQGEIMYFDAPAPVSVSAEAS